MKKYLPALVMLAILCGLAVTGRAKIMDQQAAKAAQTIQAKAQETPHS